MTPAPSEHNEQSDLVTWCRAQGLTVWAVPNGMHIAGEGRGRYGRVRRAKQAGLLPGAPDLVIGDRCPLDGCPVAIEVKRARGGRLSPEQLALHDRLERLGWRVIIARGAHDGIAQLLAMGYGLPGEMPPQSHTGASAGRKRHGAGVA